MAASPRWSKRRASASREFVQGSVTSNEQATNPPTISARAQRVRRPGAGRPLLVETDPTLQADLDSLVDPVTRGDPESPLRWTCKSKDKLAAELVATGHKVSPTKVGRLLADLGYCLQLVRKTREGNQSPDRSSSLGRPRRPRRRVGYCCRQRPETRMAGSAILASGLIGCDKCRVALDLSIESHAIAREFRF
jgi:Rhodopirellula transposase DDE domain